MNFSNASRSCVNVTEHIAPVLTPIASVWLMGTLVYLLPIVCFFGIIGNILSFIILKPSALRVASHFFLLCLTVADILSLLSLMPSFWAVMLLHPYYHQIYEEHVTWVERYLLVYGGCQARLLLTFYTRTISIWLIVLFTAERLVSVLWPLKALNWCTPRKAMISVALLCGAAFFLNIPWAFSFDRIPVRCSHRFKCKRNKVLIVNRVIETAFLSIIPAIVVCVFNTVIIIAMKRHAKSNMLHDNRHMNRLQRAITKRLLVISSMFVILTCPSMVFTAIYTVYELREDHSMQRSLLADGYHISMFLFMLNLAINFLLYLLTGKNFRRAALSLLLCRVDSMRYYRSVMMKGGSSSQNNPKTERMSLSGSRTALHRPSESGLPLQEGTRPLLASKGHGGFKGDEEKKQLVTSPNLSLRNGTPELGERFNVDLNRQRHLKVVGMPSPSEKDELSPASSKAPLIKNRSRAKSKDTAYPENEQTSI